MTGWRPMGDEPRDGTPFLIRSGNRVGIAFIDPRTYDGRPFEVSGAVLCGPDPHNYDRPGIAMANHFLREAEEWCPVP